MRAEKSSRAWCGACNECESMKCHRRQQQRQQQQQHQLQHHQQQHEQQLGRHPYHHHHRTGSCDRCWRNGCNGDNNNNKRTASSGKGSAIVADEASSPSLKEWLPCLIPPALAVGIYSNSLGGDFVHDDLSAITGNRDITDPTAGTWDFLYNDFWGTSLLDPRSHKSYRPLTILTFK